MVDLKDPVRPLTVSTSWDKVRRTRPFWSSQTSTLKGSSLVPDKLADGAIDLGDWARDHRNADTGHPVRRSRGPGARVAH